MRRTDLPLSLLALVMALLSAGACAMTLTELEAKAKTDVATPDGKKYEMDAVRAFWGSYPAFMKECAPPDAPLAEPFSIFVEIKSNGAMGQLEFNPNTKVAQCISKHVRDRRYPIPPYPYVLRIDMSFQR